MSLLTTTAINFAEISAIAVPALIKKCGVLDPKSFTKQVYDRLTLDEQVIIRRATFVERIEKDSKEMNTPAEAWKDYVPVGSGKLSIDIGTDDKNYISLRKDAYRLAKGDANKLKSYRAMVKKSIDLMDLYKLIYTVQFIQYFLKPKDPSEQINYEFEFPELDEKDKEFINALANHFWPSSYRLFYPEVECPNINKYNASNKNGEWKETCIINNELLEMIEKDFLNMYGYLEFLPEVSPAVTPEQPVAILKHNTPKYESPIYPVTKQKNVPFMFINGGDASMNNHQLPEATRTKWEYKVVDPNTDFREVKMEEENKTEFKLPEGIEVPENFDEEEFKLIVSAFEGNYRNTLTYNIRKDEYNVPVIDVMTEKGNVTNIIDTGRFAGGKRVSIIGTAVNAETGIKYPQFIDVNENPEIAYKVLNDPKYHLTEDERQVVSHRYAVPAIYEWFDFTGCSFISEMNDTDLAHFWYNCFVIINRIKSAYQVAVRLRIVHFADICNFTVISDNKCSCIYRNYGILQNDNISENIRIEIRGGKIYDNSTTIIPNQQPQVQQPMFQQPMMPNQDPNVMASTFVRVEREPKQNNEQKFFPNFTNTNVNNIPDNLTPEQVISLLNDPRTTMEYRQALAIKYKDYLK